MHCHSTLPYTTIGTTKESGKILSKKEILSKEKEFLKSLQPSLFKSVNIYTGEK